MKSFLKRTFYSLLVTIPLTFLLVLIFSLLFPHLGFVTIVAISTAISVMPGVKAGNSILKSRVKSGLNIWVLY